MKLIEASLQTYIYIYMNKEQRQREFKDQKVNFKSSWTSRGETRLKTPHAIRNLNQLLAVIKGWLWIQIPEVNGIMF